MVPGSRRGGVIVISKQNWARVAAVGALVAALGLSACGRKGPLDPPPSAAAHSAQAAPTTVFRNRGYRAASPASVRTVKR